MDYKNAGVDIEAGYKSVELMKEHIRKTVRPEMLGGIGGFSGAFSMEKFKDMEKPTLVSGTDGVGTKLKLAFLMDRQYAGKDRGDREGSCGGLLPGRSGADRRRDG